MQNVATDPRFANRSAVRNFDSSALQPDLRILWNISIFQRIAYHVELLDGVFAAIGPATAGR